MLFRPNVIQLLSKYFIELIFFIKMVYACYKSESIHYDIVTQSKSKTRSVHGKFNFITVNIPSFHLDKTVDQHSGANFKKSVFLQKFAANFLLFLAFLQQKC